MLATQKFITLMLLRNLKGICYCLVVNLLSFKYPAVLLEYAITS